MITRVAKRGRQAGSTFGTKIDYALRQGREQERDHLPPLEVGFSRVTSLETAAQEMGATAAMSRAKLPVYSFSISLDEGEQFAPGQARAVLDHHLTALGLETHQYVWSVQNDGRTGKHHIHAVVNLVSPDTHIVVQPYKDFDKLQAADRDGERQFGFRQVVVERTGLSAEARDYEYYQHRPSLERRIGEEIGPAIREVLNHADATWADVHHTCAQLGVRYEQVTQGERVVGGRFTDDGIQHAKASKLGPDLSHSKLVDRLGTFEASREPQRERTAEDVIARAERLAHDARIMPDQIIGQLTKHEAVFTEQQAKKLIEKTVEDKDLRGALWADVHNAALKVGGTGEARFTTREIWDAETGLKASLAARDMGGHRCAQAAPAWIEGQQREAFAYACQAGQVKHIDGVAGAGKTTFMQAVATAHEAEGYRVHGLSTDHVAVKEMQKAGISSRTVASQLYKWEANPDEPRFGRGDLVVIDEISKLGAKDAAAIYNAAIRGGAKVIDMGDRAQFESVGPSPAMRLIERAEPGYDLTKTRRQVEQWARTAVEDIRAGNVRAAYAAYRDRGLVHESGTQAEARAAVAARFAEIEASGRHCSIGTLTNAERIEMNVAARDAYRELGRLQGEDRMLATMDGTLPYASGDRIIVRSTIRELGLANRDEATVVSVENEMLRAKRADGQVVTLDMRERDHNQIQHAYCQTDFGTQSRTHDAHLQLASKHVNARSAMVSMSRHTQTSEVHYSREQFPGGYDQLVKRASRETQKELATDYRILREPNSPEQIREMRADRARESVRTPGEKRGLREQYEHMLAERRAQEAEREVEREQSQRRGRSL